MACILRPECNFLHGYFRCQLPVEMVDVEVKVKMMQDIHMFPKNIENHQLQPLGHKAPSLPLPHPKDENVFGVRREAWPKAQAPTPDPSTANPTKHQPHD